MGRVVKALGLSGGSRSASITEFALLAALGALAAFAAIVFLNDGLGTLVSRILSAIMSG